MASDLTSGSPVMTAEPTPQSATTAGFRRSVATTTAANLVSTAAAGLTGILIARSLGASARGEYAAIMAWFGVTLILGEMGQTAATTYFVAKARDRARDYVATSRNMMVVTGLIVMIGGIACAPLLGQHSQSAENSYRVMFGTCIFSFVGASLIFSLQATRTSQWNLVRLFQPLSFAAAVWALEALNSLTLVNCITVTSATILLQSILAYCLCRRGDLTGGRASFALGREMVGYGLAQLASAAPAALVARLDVLVLSITVDPAELGHYAVATSVTSLALPVVSGIGSVIFPRIALQTGSKGGTTSLERRSLLLAGTLSAALATAIAAASTWVVPMVFGEDYRASVPLVFILAPGLAALATNQVCGDILRGHGRPLSVAKVQWTAAGATTVGVAVLLPLFGTAGTALALTSSALIGLVLSLISIHRTWRRVAAT